MDSKELKRLEKPHFLTMVKDLLPSTIDALKGWKEPPGAYVLFEARKRRLNSEYDKVDHSSLFTLWVEHRPYQEMKIQYYCRKGFRPIHYAKFPDFNDSDPVRRQLAITHAGKDRRNPWKHLEAVVLEAMKHGSDDWKKEKVLIEADKKLVEQKSQELQEQNKALERKVAALEAKKNEQSGRGKGAET